MLAIEGHVGRPPAPTMLPVIPILIDCCNAAQVAGGDRRRGPRRPCSLRNAARRGAGRVLRIPLHTVHSHA
jgi:hypothetical protein